MGKQSRAANRAKAAAAAQPPSQVYSEEQLAEMRAKFARQQKFQAFVGKRPVPTHWQPVMQYLATLDKVADVRYTDETLRELTDDQIVHGMMTENITVYKARVGANLLTHYSVKQQYPKPRWPITQTEFKFVIERQKQAYLERMRPLFGPEVLVNGRINIPAYFAALEQIRENDIAQAAYRDAAQALAAGGKDIAARIAAGEINYQHVDNVGKSAPVENLVGGFVQVETKKPEEAVLVDAQDPMAAGLALERQAEVDATFEAAKLATDIPEKWPAEQEEQ